MNILFISCSYSDIDAESFRKNSKRGYQFAAQAFQNALISGFISNGVNVTVLSFPSLSTFPFGYKKPFIKGHDYIVADENLGKSLSILNLPFCNRPFQPEYKSFISQWLENKRNEQNAVVVYGINPQLMKMAKYAKSLVDNIHLILVAPDLPEFMRFNSIYTRLGLKKRQILTSYKEIQNFDGYVLLTDSMKYKMNFGHKPYTVVEGIYQDIITLKKDQDLTSLQKFQILYSGSLSKRYGIITLLEAFKMIGLTDVELILCGNGDAVPDILEYSKNDKRIKYLGILPMTEVRQLQKEVNLLINPRSSKEIFTQYSFPSKTMEYMASGTPTLMSKLKCIPKEYYPYLYFFEDESSHGIKESVEKIYHISPAVRAQLGDAASSFIKNEKNAKKQTLKITNLINQIQNSNVNFQG